MTKTLNVAPPQTFSVLGVRVNAIQIPHVITCMEAWIASRAAPQFIAVTGMHGLTEAQHDVSFKSILNSAALVVPDGMPLVWLARLRGFLLRRRVYGPELMSSFWQQTARKNYRHFLYGGAPKIADVLAKHLSTKFPGNIIVGTLSPPYRPLTIAEQNQIAATINAARPDIIWVGLGTPKQERWMHDFTPRLTAPVLVGVGAAFDLLTGRVRQAPSWMSEHGLEWLFRLSQEPRRLWRRYLLYGPQFAALVALELARLKKFR